MSFQPALSASRAKDYLQCPLKFRLSVVDRIPQPTTEAQAKGTLVHAVLEHLFEQPATERTVEAATALVDPEFAKLRKNDPSLVEIFADPEQQNEFLSQTRALLEGYFRLERPENLEPFRREQKIEVRLSSGVLLRGIVDRIDRAPNGALRVIDYKTGRAPSPRFMEDALFQMRFYALLLRGNLRLPARMQLLYLKSQQVLTLDPTDRDIEGFEEQVNDLWQRIEGAAHSGDFSPQRSKLCGWCPYQQYCPEYEGTPPQLSESGINRLLRVRQSA